jgi:hypothetical protein
MSILLTIAAAMLLLFLLAGRCIARELVRIRQEVIRIRQDEARKALARELDSIRAAIARDATKTAQDHVKKGLNLPSDWEIR